MNSQNIFHDKVKTNDGFELDVEIKTPDNYKKTVVMSHGMTSNKEGRKGQLTKIANALFENGYRVIQFDYRGHGKSSGKDLDVCPTSYFTDLKTIIDTYVNEDEYYIFGFSFGGFSVNQYLYKTKDARVKKVALIGPALDPINSSLYNANEFCYPEIHEAEMDGSLENNGYAYWASKDWKVSKRLIDECKDYNYREAISYLPKDTLILQGSLDKNVDYTYNKKFAEEFGFKYKEFEASHSLSEVIDDVVGELIPFYGSENNH